MFTAVPQAWLSQRAGIVNACPGKSKGGMGLWAGRCARQVGGALAGRSGAARQVGGASAIAPAFIAMDGMYAGFAGA